MSWLLFPTASEHDARAEAYLILTVALKVAKFGVEVVGLDGAYPDMLRDRDIQATSNGKGERCVITRWEFSYRRWEVTIEPMYSAKQPLSEWLKFCVIGETHADPSHPVEETESGVEVWDMVCRMASSFDNSGKIAP